MSGNYTRISSPVGNDASKTDWQRLKSLTNRAIDQAIAADGDAYAISPSVLGHSHGRYHYNIFQDPHGSWRWQLVSKDGRILAETARGWESRQKAQEAIAEVRTALLGTALAA